MRRASYVSECLLTCMAALAGTALWQFTLLLVSGGLLTKAYTQLGSRIGGGGGGPLKSQVCIICHRFSKTRYPKIFFVKIAALHPVFPVKLIENYSHLATNYQWVTEQKTG